MNGTDALPDTESGTRPPRHPRNLADRILARVGSFNIAIVAFMFMIIVTLAGTVLQKTHGLYDCQRWYFESWVTPKEGFLFGFLPLPGMALLLAVIFVNVLAGGILRIRKSPRTIGVIIAHLSMLGFIIAGAVSLWSKREGHMRVFEKESSRHVEAAQEWVIEVRELPGPGGENPVESKVLYFSDSLFDDRTGPEARSFRHSSWPFRIDVSQYVKNATVVPSGDPTLPQGTFVFGEYALKEVPYDPSKDTPTIAGVMVRAINKDGSEASAGLLEAERRRPLTLESGGRRFALTLTREQWEVPFRIRLDDFRAVYFPGTRKAESFESDITVLHDNGAESKHLIWMNNPLRDSGYVAYQTSYDSNSPAGQEKYSVFTVVKNRSDQWPLYSLCVCTFGLLLHFGIKLWKFLRRSPAPVSAPAPAPVPALES